MIWRFPSQKNHKEFEYPLEDFNKEGLIRLIHEKDEKIEALSKQLQGPKNAGLISTILYAVIGIVLVLAYFFD